MPHIFTVFSARTAFKTTSYSGRIASKDSFFIRMLVCLESGLSPLIVSDQKVFLVQCGRYHLPLQPQPALLLVIRCIFVALIPMRGHVICPDTVFFHREYNFYEFCGTPHHTGWSIFPCSYFSQSRFRRSHICIASTAYSSSQKCISNFSR